MLIDKIRNSMIPGLKDLIAIEKEYLKWLIDKDSEKDLIADTEYFITLLEVKLVDYIEIEASTEK